MLVEPSPHTTLGYERRRGPREGLFAGRFVALSAISLVIGLPLLVIDVLGLLGGVRVAMRVEYLPWGILAAPLVRVLLDAMLLSGSTGALWRAAWARHTLLTYAWGELLHVLVLFGLGMLGAVMSDARAGPGARLALWAGLAYLALRALWACVCHYAYRSIHADFYFARDPQTPLEAVPVMPISAVEPRAARYRVRGRDLSSGQQVEYDSAAATELLARKAAIALGLDPPSVTVEATNVVHANERTPT